MMANAVALVERSMSSMPRSDPPLVPMLPRTRRLHPGPVRVMHWINAVAIFFMLVSGWKIYEDEVIFGWLHFPDWLTIGPWAQHGLQVHFLFMWILVANGVAYVAYGLATGRLRRMLLPISGRELVANVGDALRLRLAHDDATRYNAVQKLLYLGVLAAGVVIVASGLVLWKPIQLSPAVTLVGGFQAVRLIHFLAMAAIFAFVVVHVSLALLVPKTLASMVTGGPLVDPAADGVAHGALAEHA